MEEGSAKTIARMNSGRHGKGYWNRVGIPMISWIIRSGGQTGVDRAALQVAVKRCLPYVGWCPRGGLAEDCPTPPGILAQFPNLVETPSADPRQRTAWNVRDSHATVIVVDEQGFKRSRGTRFTRTVAELIFVRPWRAVTLDNLDAPSQIVVWLKQLRLDRGEGSLVVNFAGPRESQAPGIQARARRFIDDLFAELVES